MSRAAGAARREASVAAGCERLRDEQQDKTLKRHACGFQDEDYLRLNLLALRQFRRELIG